MNYTELVTAVTDYTENTFPTADMNIFIRQAEQRIYNSVQFPSLRKNVTGVLVNGNKYVSCPDDFLSSFSFAVIDGSGNYEYLLNKDVNFIRQAYPNPTDTAFPKYYSIFGPTTTSTTPPSLTNELSFIVGPTPDANYDVELHYYFYPESIVQSPITALGAVTGGSSYVDGTYYSVPLTGGSGSGATATIVVSSGVVTSATISNGGSKYLTTDTLSASASNVGGSGSGFSVPVTAVGNATGTTWLGDNFDTVLLYGTLVEAYTYMKGEADLAVAYNTKYKEALELAKRLGDGLERGDAYRDGQTKLKVVA